MRECRGSWGSGREEEGLGAESESETEAQTETETETESESETESATDAEPRARARLGPATDAEPEPDAGRAPALPDEPPEHVRQPLPERVHRLHVFRVRAPDRRRNLDRRARFAHTLPAGNRVNAPLVRPTPAPGSLRDVPRRARSRSFRAQCALVCTSRIGVPCTRRRNSSAR